MSLREFVPAATNRAPVPLRGPKVRRRGGRRGPLRRRRRIRAADTSLVVLVVEDDVAVQAVLCSIIHRMGHTAIGVASARAALQSMKSVAPTAMVLDLGLPDIDGLHVLRTIRAQGRDTAVLILTGRQSPADVLTAFDAGTDDYMKKPFDVQEFEARIGALIRRHGRRRRNSVLVAGPLVVDTVRREAGCNGRELSLTPKEFDLLVLLARNCGEFVPMTTVAASVWGHVPPLRTTTYRVTVWNLRRKLQSRCPLIGIESDRRSGYALRLPAALHGRLRGRGGRAEPPQ